MAYRMSMSETQSTVIHDSAYETELPEGKLHLLVELSSIIEKNSKPSKSSTGDRVPSVQWSSVAHDRKYYFSYVTDGLESDDEEAPFALSSYVLVVADGLTQTEQNTRIICIDAASGEMVFVDEEANRLNPGPNDAEEDEAMSYVRDALDSAKAQAN